MIRYVLLALAAIAMVSFAPMARPHNAPGGWTYDQGCCNGGDCAQLPYGAVTLQPDGYHVDLEPGDHPVATDGFHRVFPIGSGVIKHSHDEYFHACFGNPTFLRCLYVPDLAG